MWGSDVAAGEERLNGILDTRYWIQDTGYKIQDTGYKIQDTRYKIQDTGSC